MKYLTFLSLRYLISENCVLVADLPSQGYWVCSRATVRVRPVRHLAGRKFREAPSNSSRINTILMQYLFKTQRNARICDGQQPKCLRMDK